MADEWHTRRCNVQGCRPGLEMRSPPALDQIPLHSPLYGGVYLEELVTCYLSPPPPLTRKPNHTVQEVQRPGVQTARGLPEFSEFWRRVACMVTRPEADCVKAI